MKRILVVDKTAVDLLSEQLELEQHLAADHAGCLNEVFFNCETCVRLTGSLQQFANFLSLEATKQ